MSKTKIEIYPMEAKFETGTRYVPVRETAGERRLDTQWIAYSPEEALAAARLSDRNYLDEWVAAAPVVGVVEVHIELRQFMPVAEIA